VTVPALNLRLGGSFTLAAGPATLKSYIRRAATLPTARQDETLYAVRARFSMAHSRGR